MENKKQSRTEQPVTDISIYVAALEKTYKPAQTPADATHFFTTEEVVQAITEIDPSAKVKPAEVFAALRAAGFDFCNRPGSIGISFRWMLKERKDISTARHS